MSLCTGSQSGSTSTMPTNNAASQAASASMSRTHSRSKSHVTADVQPVMGQDDGVTGDSQGMADSSWGHRLAQWYPLVKIMEVQVQTRRDSLKTDWKTKMLQGLMSCDRRVPGYVVMPCDRRVQGCVVTDFRLTLRPAVSAFLQDTSACPSPA